MTKPKPRTASVVRRDGREPMGLGTAIGALVTERAWELPAAGATLRQRWEAIAPERAGHVVGVSLTSGEPSDKQPVGSFQGFAAAVFFGWRGTVLALSRCP